MYMLDVNTPNHPLSPLSLELKSSYTSVFYIFALSRICHLPNSCYLCVQYTAFVISSAYFITQIVCFLHLWNDLNSLLAEYITPLYIYLNSFVSHSMHRMALKIYPHPNLLELVNLLHGKGDFGDVIKVANFKAGALACIIQVNQIIQYLKGRAFFHWCQRGLKYKRDMVTCC